MKLRVLALVLVLLTPLLRAAEITAGWRMPLEMLTRHLPEDTGLRKLDKAPGESAFFQPGDELRDVSKLREWPYAAEAEEEPEDPFGGNPSPDKLEAWQGKWLVWNARSGMFIARGSCHDISAAERGLGFREQPGVIRATFELEIAGAPPRALSVVLRSSEEAKIRADDMELVLSVVASGDGELADLTTTASWKGGKDGNRWQYAGTVCLWDNSRHLPASQGSGDSAWKLFVTTRYERVGGIPRSEARWMEVAGKLRHWPTGDFSRSSFRKPLGGDREVAGFSVNMETLLLFRPGLEGAVVEVPEALKEFAEGPVVDLREWLEPLGVNLSRPGFFVGYDLLASRVGVIGDEQTVGLVEVLFESVLDDRPVASLWISTNEASGGWGVSARSGERARLVRLDASGKEDLLFEVEPTIGGDNRIIDLRLNADLVAGGVARGRVESAVTLVVGQPMEVARRAIPEGGEVAMEVTASMVPFKR